MNKHFACLIRKSEHEIRKRMNAELKEIYASALQYAVLIRLVEFHGLSNANLAGKSFVTPKSMSQIFLTLTKWELIVRNIILSNGKIQQTHLTGTGKIILKKVHKIANNISESLFENLTDNEKILLSSFLKNRLVNKSFLMKIEFCFTHIQTCRIL